MANITASQHQSVGPTNRPDEHDHRGTYRQ